MAVRFARLAAASAAACAMAASAQAATPVSGTIEAYGQAEIQGVVTTRDIPLSWTGTPTNLSATANATALYGDGGNYAFAHERINATFGATAGQVTMVAGWLFHGGENDDVSASVGGFPDWSYTFIADGDGLFGLTYDVTAGGPTAGLQGWVIGWTGSGGGFDPTNAADPTASGVFTRSILAGQTYTVSLTSPGATQTNGVRFASAMTGNFTYAIDEVIAPPGVPEPGTWAMMLAGFGGLGAMLRRRRAVLA